MFGGRTGKSPAPTCGDILGNEIIDRVITTETRVVKPTRRITAISVQLIAVIAYLVLVDTAVTAHDRMYDTVVLALIAIVGVPVIAFFDPGVRYPVAADGLRTGIGAGVEVIGVPVVAFFSRGHDPVPAFGQGTVAVAPVVVDKVAVVAFFSGVDTSVPADIRVRGTVIVALIAVVRITVVAFLKTRFISIPAKGSPSFRKDRPI